jgi:hypothetical protein
MDGMRVGEGRTDGDDAAGSMFWFRRNRSEGLDLGG